MKKIILIAGAILSLMSHSALSEVAVKRSTSIQWLHAVSANRPAEPDTQGLSRVYVNDSSSWGATNCRADAADIQNGDSAILELLKIAISSNSIVTIEVDDSLPTRHGVCKITAVWIK
ncbi:hypothetical protein C2869_19205 [Saccharobesus litoralis]|uniref:Uncharacterized protein n=2 Tax=Saccharobesus litoralis TaxID=2172099 RepID=A0A2S0VW52_9ALTE|nr:hypothetical protein C2869_19205 [Saccharobesus litoralis]